MPRQILCVVLAALLCRVDLAAQAADRTGDMKSRIQSLGANRLVEVRLVDGPKLRGWIGAVSENEFELRLGKEKLETRSLGFDELRSVKAVKSLKASHTGRNILIGVAIAVAAIGLAIVIAAKRVGYI